MSSSSTHGLMIGLALVAFVLAVVAFIVAPSVETIGHVITVSAIGAGLLGISGALLAGFLAVKAARRD